jgi:hypothetical protein
MSRSSLGGESIRAQYSSLSNRRRAIYRSSDFQGTAGDNGYGRSQQRRGGDLVKKGIYRDPSAIVSSASRTFSLGSIEPDNLITFVSSPPELAARRRLAV